jgi:hypothetical protein
VGVLSILPTQGRLLSIFEQKCNVAFNGRFESNVKQKIKPHGLPAEALLSEAQMCYLYFKYSARITRIISVGRHSPWLTGFVSANMLSGTIWKEFSFTKEGFKRGGEQPKSIFVFLASCAGLFPELEIVKMHSSSADTSTIK